jgi:hypothetical protein
LIIAAASLMNNTGLANGAHVQAQNPDLTLDAPDGPLSMALPEDPFRSYFVADSGVGSRAELQGDVKPVVSHDFMLETATVQVSPVAYADVGDALQPVDNMPRTALGRRVILGTDEAQDYNRWGWALFDNAVSWSTYDSLPANPEYRCLLIAESAGSGGERPLADHHIITRMRRAGCDVVIPGDQSPDDVDLVVISPTAPAAAVVPMANRAAPTLVLFDEANTQVVAMGLASSVSPPSTQGSWEFSPDANAGLRANFSDSLVVFDQTNPVPVVAPDKRAPGAVVVATAEGTDSATHYYVEEGQGLADGQLAPADRVALGLAPLAWDEARTEVFDLFDSSVAWLLWRTR